MQLLAGTTEQQQLRHRPPAEPRDAHRGHDCHSWAVAAWLLLAVATLSLSVAAAGPGTLPGDARVLRTIQSLDLVPIEVLARITNVIATGVILTTAMLLSTLVFWIRGHREAAYTMLIATLLRAVNPLLKVLVASPRPTAAAATITETASGFGFPSGHTTGAVLALGTLAFVIPTLTQSRVTIRIVRLVAIAGIIITGYGRLMTGAHWPSDVLGGIGWGLLLLALAHWIGHWLAAHTEGIKKPAVTPRA